MSDRRVEIRRRRRQQRLVSGKSAEETVNTVAQGRPDGSGRTCGD